jgi:hypothetical protein
MAVALLSAEQLHKLFWRPGEHARVIAPVNHAG